MSQAVLDVASTPQDLDREIERCIVGPLSEFGLEPRNDCALVFLTGSYARGTHNKWSPNVNIYFVSKPGSAAEVRLRLGQVFDGIRAELRRSDIDFCIDCHPYTVAYRPLGAARSITLTTKVMDSGVPRWSLPPTIGLGWLAKYRVLAGEPGLLELIRIPPETSLEWFQALHEALGRYRNIVDHLPWALPWRQHPALLAEESLRYAEEAIRDALPVAMTEQELREGRQFDLYFKWSGGAPEFLAERYGAEGVWMDKAVSQLKAAYLDRDTRWTPATAEDAWRVAVAVCEIVWRKFRERVTAEHPADAGWMGRVNAFV